MCIELHSQSPSPRRSVVHAGDSLTLACRLTSVPSPVILWFRTAPEVGSRRVRVRPNERVAISVDGTLQLNIFSCFLCCHRPNR